MIERDPLTREKARLQNYINKNSIDVELQLIETTNADKCWGFIHNNKEIYYDEQSLCFVVCENGQTRETSLR
jgi:hypothetical protein